MKSKRTIRFIVCTLALGAGLTTAALGQEKKKTAMPPPTMTTAESKTDTTKSVEHLIEVTATVQAIDLAHREVTLKGPEGNVETVMVPPEVRRITDIKVGDEVNIQYYIGMAAELRPPTEEEKKEPYKVMEDEARAPKTAAPAGMKAKVIRVERPDDDPASVSYLHWAKAIALADTDDTDGARAIMDDQLMKDAQLVSTSMEVSGRQYLTIRRFLDHYQDNLTNMGVISDRLRIVLRS